jgi:three-Cys-motif partner protein
MNKFGGDWTKQKINIVESYAKAYLTVMKSRPYWSLLYFDGFAGTGEINTENDDFEVTEGVAKRILEINHPRPFDMYYFVELDCDKKGKLEEMIQATYPTKQRVYVQAADCNDKLLDLAGFLNSEKGRNFKVLAFIDPCGMELNWNSLEALKGHDIDLWILVPTGVGANRLLKRDGNISEAWITRLTKFLGIRKEEIMEYFYQQHQELTLFGTQDIIVKERNSIERIHNLYKERLKTIFKFVSDSFVLKNSMNSIMFHFFMATNNKTALKIANDIIKPKYRM